MPIRSRNSSKTLAYVRATLTLQTQPSDDALANFKDRIDGSKLKRLGEPTQRRVLSDGRFELECQVEYGPVYGAHKSDIDRAIKPQNGEKIGAFNCTRKEVTETEIKALEQRAEETESLEEREELELLLSKLGRKS